MDFQLEQNIRQSILDNQRSVLADKFFPRELRIERIVRKATVITGMRRVGKSIYQRLYVQSLVKEGIPVENMCMLDFSDDRLVRLRKEAPGVIADIYYSLFPQKTKEKVYFFFDEIQYLHQWELFVNRLQNTRDCEVNITGSSAKLLVREIATEFGGRSLAWELFPFSFREFVGTKQDMHALPALDKMGSQDEHYCRQWFDEYVRIGGLPESLLMTNARTRVTYLQQIAETVVFRDVVQRFDLPNANEVWRLMQLSLNQMGCMTSFTKLKQRMAGEQYRISQVMVRDVMGYFVDAYLVYMVEICSLNAAVRATNPKKLYCADHALAMAVAEKMTPDWGIILENIIFLHLRRQSDKIYYARTESGYEVDFVIASSTDSLPLALVQVCHEMEGPGTFERETRALFEAMDEYGLVFSTMVTYNTQDLVEKDGKRIEVVPAWKFLLAPEQRNT